MADGNVTNVDSWAFHSTVVADHLHQVENRGEKTSIVLGISIWMCGHLEAGEVGCCCCSQYYFAGSLSRKSRKCVCGDAFEL